VADTQAGLVAPRLAMRHFETFDWSQILSKYLRCYGIKNHEVCHHVAVTAVRSSAPAFARAVAKIFKASPLRASLLWCSLPLFCARRRRRKSQEALFAAVSSSSCMSWLPQCSRHMQALGLIASATSQHSHITFHPLVIRVSIRFA
jgi:hypothetical protein